MIQMTPQSHKVHPNALLNLLLRKSLTMTRKLLKEDIDFLKKNLVMSLIEELSPGNLPNRSNNPDLQFQDNQDDHYHHEIPLILKIEEDVIDQFHHSQRTFGDFQMYPHHIDAIPLEFTIHQLDLTMSMVKEIQWI